MSMSMAVAMTKNGFLGGHELGGAGGGVGWGGGARVNAPGKGGVCAQGAAGKTQQFDYATPCNLAATQVMRYAMKQC